MQEDAHHVFDLPFFLFGGKVFSVNPLVVMDDFQKRQKRRKMQFGHMRDVVSGGENLKKPFATIPPKLRPKWVRRREGQVEEEDETGYRPPYADD